MKARADAGIGSAVVIHHGETEAEGEQEAREVIELERTSSAGGGKCRLNAVPHNQDGGEHAEQVLAHSVEEAEVVGEQLADSLEDKLKIVGVHEDSAPSAYG